MDGRETIRAISSSASRQIITRPPSRSESWRYGITNCTVGERLPCHYHIDARIISQDMFSDAQKGTEANVSIFSHAR